jgi:hypothetical protein
MDREGDIAHQAIIPAMIERPSRKGMDFSFEKP